MLQLKECRTGADVIENYKAVRARMRALKPPAPKITTIAIVDRTPEPVPIMIARPEPEPMQEAAEPEQPRYPAIADIVRHVGKHYGFSYTDMVSARRHGPLVRARLIAYYLCKELTPRSFPWIGRHIGNRDHSTVMTGIKNLMRRMRADPDIAMEVDELQRDIARVLR